MKDKNPGFSGKTSWPSRRTLLRSTAATVVGAGLFHPKWVFAGHDAAVSGSDAGTRYRE